MSSVKEIGKQISSLFKDPRPVVGYGEDGAEVRLDTNSGQIWEIKPGRKPDIWFPENKGVSNMSDAVEFLEKNGRHLRQVKHK